MTLRAKNPAQIEKRLKCLFYGTAGVGKTTAALNFPNAYLIDTEQGAVHSQYLRLLEKNNSVSFQTTDFDDLIIEATALLSNKHNYKTLIIDSLTGIYAELIDKSAKKLALLSKDKNDDGTGYGRHYSLANKSVKHLMNILFRLDMNVIITSHSKDIYSADGKMQVLGQTFDCYKKLDYMFDLVLEIRKHADNRIAMIRKSRIETMPIDTTFDFSYNYIADKYGRDILEKASIAEQLATKEQIYELEKLIKFVKLPDEMIEKWLNKANADSFAEMNQDVINKCIEYIKNKIMPNAIIPNCEINNISKLNEDIDQ